MVKKESDKFQENSAQSIKSFLENMVETSPENRFFLIDDSPIFTAPLIGFADGDDPLFYEYKETISKGQAMFQAIKLVKGGEV